MIDATVNRKLHETAWRNSVLRSYKSGKIPLVLAERALAEGDNSIANDAKSVQVDYTEQNFPNKSRLKL